MLCLFWQQEEKVKNEQNENITKETSYMSMYTKFFHRVVTLHCTNKTLFHFTCERTFCSSVPINVCFVYSTVNSTENHVSYIYTYAYVYIKHETDPFVLIKYIKLCCLDGINIFLIHTWTRREQKKNLRKKNYINWIGNYFPSGLCYVLYGSTALYSEEEL